jgi:hypothetical protein
MSHAVGIDDINLYAGPLTISYDTIARGRGLTEREREHAQFVRRSVVPPFERSRRDVMMWRLTHSPK